MLFCLLLLSTESMAELAALNETIIDHKTIDELITISITTESSDTVNVQINNNDIRISIDGSDDVDVHRMYEKYQGLRFPHIKIEPSNSCKFVVTQLTQTSDLNVSIVSSSVSFEGENPITVCKWEAVPSSISNRQLTFKVSVPFLHLHSGTSISYIFEAPSLEFESIDFSGQQSLSTQFNGPLSLKLKYILYPTQITTSGINSKIELDVDFINFTSGTSVSFENKVKVHKHLYALLECIVTFKDLTIAEDDFMIYWLTNYVPKTKGLKGDIEMKRLGIQIVIDETGSLTPPPSNVIHFMVRARSIESFEKGIAYMFAKVPQKYTFDILYDKKSDIGTNGYCNVMSLTYYYESYAFTIKETLEPEVTLIYSKKGQNKGFINTLDSSKWDYTLIDPCATTTINIYFTEQPDTKLNIDYLQTLYPIDLVLGSDEMTVNIEFDFTDVGVRHLCGLFMTGDFVIKSSNDIDLGNMADPCEFYTEHGDVNMNAVLDKIKLDNVKKTSLTLSAFKSSNGRLARGKNVEINMYNYPNNVDATITYYSGKVEMVYEGKTYTFDALNSKYYINGLTSARLAISGTNPTNNVQVTAESIDISNIDQIPKGWFPISSSMGGSVKINEKIPLIPSLIYSGPKINSNSNSITILTPDDMSKYISDSYRLYFSYNPQSISSININEGKLSVPFLDYRGSEIGSYEPGSITSQLEGLELTGFSFDDILKSGQLNFNLNELTQYSTAELRKMLTFDGERYSKNFKNSFPQFKYTNITLKSSNYLDVDESNSKLTEVNFVFKENGFPPLMTSSNDFKGTKFTFKYERAGSGTYDSFGIFFNQLVPVAILSQSKCNDFTLEYDQTSADMEIKCVDKEY